MARHRRRMPAAARRQVDHRRRSGFCRNIRPGDRDTGARVLELRRSRARASAYAAGHVDIAVDQSPSARRRVRHQLQPLRRAGDAGQPDASPFRRFRNSARRRRSMPFPARARTAFRTCSFASQDWASNQGFSSTWRGSASYVTGAHSMKFGYQGAYHRVNQSYFSQRHAPAVPTQ